MITLRKAYTHLVQHYGSKMIILLFANYFAIKGAVNEIVYRTTLPYLKDYLQMGGSEYQVYGALYSLAFAAKPMIALVSDEHPLWGKHKTYYILITCVLAAGSVIGLILVPKDWPHPLVGVFLFLTYFYAATADVLLEGKYSERMKSKGSLKTTMKSPLPGLSTTEQNVYPDYSPNEQGTLLTQRTPQTEYHCLDAPFPTVDAEEQRVMLPKGEEQHRHASLIVTFVWICVNAGGALGVLFVGPFVTYGYIRVPFIFALPFILQLSFFLLRGYLEEDESRASKENEHTHSDHDISPPNTSCTKYPFRKSLLLPVLSITLCVLISTLLSLYSTTKNQFIFALFSSVLLCLVFHVTYERTLALANVYMFVKAVMYLQLPGALDYYYTAGPSCVPGGPGFSYLFYQTYTMVIGYVAAMIGVSVFQMYMHMWSFRHAFIITEIVRSVATSFDLILIQRWNVAVGIPDDWMYFWGDTIAGSLMASISFMPSTILTSYLCPKGYESSVYGLLAGFQNYGIVVSTVLGAYAMDRVGMTTVEEPKCDFSALPSLLIYGRFVLPIFVVFLTYFLIPDFRISDPSKFHTQETTANVVVTTRGDM